jgi:hypothetical protein
VRHVYWPDVADAALELSRRVIAARVEQQKRARVYFARSEAVDGGEAPEAAGARLGIHAARVRSFLDQYHRIGT